MENFVPIKCFQCGAHNLLKVNWFYRDKDGTLISDKIPAYECQNCGEHTFTRESHAASEAAYKAYTEKSNMR
ncbi:YgiT-type zinc finger protein [Paenibacillus taichungensis]|uniref:YgiT-type zinc finger protein n=1 Tax=Paenibacillus taichungensis TaxID=484184 RepID=A0ABX2MSR6_9BACL|nr:YgiT-type zinc finger protein [Paenibacillus taichungensis]NUU57080.1 YgiT-type zinc finger protein [Paenibacillus taichungensis]